VPQSMVQPDTTIPRKPLLLQNLFDNLPKFHLTPKDDLLVTRKGDIAWTTFTWNLSAQQKDGTPIEADGRQTDIWEQRNGDWLIVHEHISSPASL
jgi:ketosteroid isomerase-like protein